MPTMSGPRAVISLDRAADDRRFCRRAPAARARRRTSSSRRERRPSPRARATRRQLAGQPGRMPEHRRPLVEGAAQRQLGGRVPAVGGPGSGPRRRSPQSRRDEEGAGARVVHAIDGILAVLVRDDTSSSARSSREDFAWLSLVPRWLIQLAREPPRMRWDRMRSANSSTSGSLSMPRWLPGTSWTSRPPRAILRQPSVGSSR